ncbi:hypothetical protein SCP_1401850 [Sparassis crispa]|uniref:Uncharacterized protein n=1 Tax=Sparassis crispa TaxID=139825 RepID=A0A401H340_9APHY|nr:hypothetical protein SCP_1401850 [Sparassis crispa]GBE88780.1 hypothetical protein SCP_1401850 [Sparassis crispa]
MPTATSAIQVPVQAVLVSLSSFYETHHITKSATFPPHALSLTWQELRETEFFRSNSLDPPCFQPPRGAHLLLSGRPFLPRVVRPLPRSVREEKGGEGARGVREQVVRLAAPEDAVDEETCGAAGDLARYCYSSRRGDARSLEVGVGVVERTRDGKHSVVVTSFDAFAGEVTAQFPYRKRI